MNSVQRIAAIRMSLAAIEGGISQIQAALAVAASFNDIARLNDELVSLKSKRTQLQFELMNLEASQATVADPAAPTAKISAADKKAVKDLTKELQLSMGDRRMVEAALANSGDVLKKVGRIQSVLSGTSEPALKT